MTIGDVCKILDLNHGTLRAWINLERLLPRAMSRSWFRYTPDDVENIRKIQLSRTTCAACGAVQ